MGSQSQQAPYYEQELPSTPFSQRLPGTAHLPVISSPARHKHPGLTAASPPDTGPCPPLATFPHAHRRSVTRSRPGTPQGPAHARARGPARRPPPGPAPAAAASTHQTPPAPSPLPPTRGRAYRLPIPRAMGGLGRVSAAPALSGEGRKAAPGPRGARSLPRGVPAARRVRCPARRRSSRPGSPSQPFPPLCPGRSLYLCVPRPPAPGGAAGPGAAAGGAGSGSGARRPVLAAAGRRRRPVAHSERRQQRGHVGAAVPRPRHRSREAWVGPCSPRPPRPADHWPPASSAQPFLAIIGRCVRRSQEVPAQKLFSDWVSPSALVTIGCGSRQSRRQRTDSVFLRTFFSGLAASGRTEGSGCQRAPSPLPASLPPPYPLPPGGAVCLQAIGSQRRHSRSLSCTGRRFAGGRDLARGCLLLIGRPPCQSSAAGGAAELGLARAPSRCARRLVAGRERSARPPPCPTGVSGEYPYVRAITSPPANQCARGQVSRPRGAGPGAPGGSRCSSNGPAGRSRGWRQERSGMPGLPVLPHQRARLEVSRSFSFLSCRGARALCPGSRCQ